MFDLTGKKALVTGSTQGIGFAIAECLLRQGAEVIVHGGTSEEKCRAAAEKLSGHTSFATVPLGVSGCAETLYGKTGDVDILVLNASVQFRKSWEEITEEEFEKQIRTNFLSSLQLIQKYAPAMRQKGWGRILTVGSVQQYKPHKDMVVYAGSKDGQMSMVRNLAKQLASSGVTVNNLCPGVIATPRNTDALTDPDYSKQVFAGIPMGWAGEAADCAGAALLLCSDEGRYITGSEIIVDGGMHL